MSKTKIYCNARICYRADTLANWTAANPVLLAGEHAVVTDGPQGQREKIGDGVTPFCDLEWSYGVATGKPTEKGGEIYNNYNRNKANASYSSTFGNGNECGKSVFYINEVNTADKSVTVTGDATALSANEPCSMFLASASSSGVFEGQVYERFAKVVSAELDQWGQNTVIYLSAMPFDTQIQITQGCYLWAPNKASLGNGTVGNSAFALGMNNKALHDYSLAGGANSQALGQGAVALGSSTTANGAFSCALGEGTVTTASYQTALGKYNQSESDALLSVGNGQYGQPSNAFCVYSDGTAALSKTGDGEGAVATKGYVDSLLGEGAGFELICDQKVTLDTEDFGMTVSTDTNGNPFSLKKAIFMVDFKIGSDYTGIVTLISSGKTLAYLTSQELKSSNINGFICHTDLCGNDSTGYFAFSRFNDSLYLDSSDYSFGFSNGSESSAQRNMLTSNTVFSAPLSEFNLQWQGGNITEYRVMIWGVRA